MEGISAKGVTQLHPNNHFDTGEKGNNIQKYANYDANNVRKN